MANKVLSSAKVRKNDEFYTLLACIEDELQYYKDQFADKVVYCNCDDPFKSNFFKYFVLHFNELHLKKLICTCYDGNYINTKVKQLFDYRLLVSDTNGRNAWKIEITKVDNSVSFDMTNSELMKHINGFPELLKKKWRFQIR